MNLQFAHPLLLWLLPLALLPLLHDGVASLRHASLALVPRDALSLLVGGVLRFAGALAIAALIVGLAGLYRSEVPIERIGKGAQIVVLLDRSRSMDESFSRGRANHLPGQFDEEKWRAIKGEVARRMLAEFAAKRPQDMYAWVVFSTRAIRVLDFTQKQEVVQAAIEAGNVGRGLSDTDIADGLHAALSYFNDKPYTGSRIVLLVSDGGGRIDFATRQTLSRLARTNRVAINWIYLRSFRSPGLMDDQRADESAQDAAPEHFLHTFFKDIGVPYRAYEAEDPASLERAIRDVDRLENLPLQFTELRPRQDLDHWCYALALALVLLIAVAKVTEIRAWYRPTGSAAAPR